MCVLWYVGGLSLKAGGKALRDLCFGELGQFSVVVLCMKIMCYLLFIMLVRMSPIVPHAMLFLCSRYSCVCSSKYNIFSVLLRFSDRDL